jgi:hypothetical protein
MFQGIRIGNFSIGKLTILSMMLRASRIQPSLFWAMISKRFIGGDIFLFTDFLQVVDDILL